MAFISCSIYTGKYFFLKVLKIMVDVMIVQLFNASGKIEVRGVKERIIGDLSQPISVRIENIIRQMTLEEKVAQLSNEK